MTDSLADTIVPKSDQLNADDLLLGPITVEITGIYKGEKDQPIHLAMEGRQPYKPCLSMRRVLVSAWGDNGKDWIGRSMTLYCDPTVKWAGIAIGGIRISHLSHIEFVRSIMLTKSRGMRAMFTVRPIESDNENLAISSLDHEWVAAVKLNNIVIDQIEDPIYKLRIKKLAGI